MLPRRGFLALLAAAALPVTAAARPPSKWVTVPAGFSGGFQSGFETRRVKVG